MFEDIRQAVQAAPRDRLPVVAALVWRAFSEGRITEAEAETLTALIEARRGATANRTGGAIGPAQDRVGSPRRTAGSRPRTDASMERRRRWAASGRLPPGLAARFTLAEQAVLSLVAAETAKRGDCRLSVPHLAAVAGVGESTVRNAIREARKLGLITVEERRLTGFRNDTNVVCIVSPEWTSWLRLARKGIGFKSVNRTPTQVLESGKTRTARPSRARPASSNPPSRTGSRTADA